jgi:TM2 domain-containing membrane protein YozV
VTGLRPNYRNKLNPVSLQRSPDMASSHNNKTLATLLAATLGCLGTHRFYMRGSRDPWAWLHLASVPVSLLAILLGGNQPAMFLAGPLVISALAGLLEALVIGLSPDEKWDEDFNPDSGRKSVSGWPLALLLVLVAGCGAVALIFTIARTFDLLHTGGAYG